MLLARNPRTRTYDFLHSRIDFDQRSKQETVKQAIAERLGWRCGDICPRKPLKIRLEHPLLSVAKSLLQGMIVGLQVGDTWVRGG